MPNNYMTQIDYEIYTRLAFKYEVISLSFDHARKEASGNEASFWPYWLKQWNFDELIIQQELQAYLACELAEKYSYQLNDIKTLNQQHWYPSLIHMGIIPVQFNDNTLTMIVSEPGHFEYLEEKKYHFNFTVKALLTDIKWTNRTKYQVLAHYYLMNKTSSVTDLVDAIIKEALASNISDIHGEPKKHQLIIRFRKDGMLTNHYSVNLDLAKKITNRLKILSQCDLANTRLPQDGHITISPYATGTQDARINFCPTIHGEKWAIRLLPQNRIQSLNDIGLTDRQLTILNKAIRQPQGLILITGPTGSGKTTTLYSILNTLNNKTKNISTIEDPVEKQLDHLNQIQINEAAGLSFATGLKALLRQDPDIIMVGELRDKETADIALKSAQTGHLVLSTLHSNSTVHTVSRLLAMGFSAELIAQSTELIIAQRLVRKICPHCHKLKHCEFCRDGYMGRIPLYEMLPFNKDIRQIIQTTPFDIDTCQNKAKALGMQTLAEVANTLFNKKLTSQEEINRVLIH